ncbi:MAG: PSD1 and planctomycete cytochrome C domain-containing protein [Armatimonadota bacterium]
MRWTGLVTGTVVVGWCAVSALAAAQKPAPRRPAKPAVKPPVKTAPAKKPAPAAPAAPADPAVSPEAAEFFEKKIRPVLAEQCYSCHGAKLQQAGLRLDSRAALLRGTDAGHPSLVPGEPDKSPLIQVLRFDGKVKMPPQGKLADPVLADFTEWVKMGAPWPGGGVQASAAPDPAKHWAFQPVRKPALPTVKNTAWAKTPVDTFILSKLEAKGLKPSPPTDRRTLLRRASYDLTGLPPSAEEIEAFVNDTSPNAWEKAVDRLLESPHYGERWARHWMDVARYADTKGYVFQEERRYPYAYTYRDWLIEAFNKDLPYDQFLVQQIAADHLELGDDKRPLAAMGFLTLGRRFLNNQADIIDDRMDVVFRGAQGLTVSCARCHDHKFDPIPIKDYYSLYGVFASSSEPRDLPLISKPQQTAEYLEFEKQLRELEGAVNQFVAQEREKVLADARAKIAVSMLAVREVAAGAEARAVAEKHGLPAGLVQRWRNFLTATSKTHHPVFAAWHELSAIPDAEFAAKAPELAARYAANADPQKRLNSFVAKLFEGAPPASLADVAERYGKLLGGDYGQLGGSDDAAQIKQALYAIGAPLEIDGGEAERLFNRDQRNRLQELRQKVDAFKVNSPAAPPRAMVLVDNPQPTNPRVFLRGNPNNPGPEVPRQFLAVLSGPERQPFQKGSGRLELAQQIASEQNPLTARVMVNRVWGLHFGTPLVDTPSDFGLRTERPIHAGLLDYLAWKFMESGWSLKTLHKEILLTAAYRQSSAFNAAAAKVDPENSLYWRANRQRLDWEALRDTLLAAAGKLDLTVGGPSVDILTPPFAPRRTVYGFIDRQNLPGLFRVFDLASPDTHSPARYETTVPQQALFLMNSPFIVQQAKNLAARPDVTAEKTPEARIQRLYRVVYGRAAAADEIALGLKFLNGAGVTLAASQSTGEKLSPWERYAQALLMSNELAFVD